MTGLQFEVEILLFYWRGTRKKMNIGCPFAGGGGGVVVIVTSVDKRAFGKIVLRRLSVG